ncbi:MAG: hypothetical protein QW751_02715 [Candidatus Aenigmatarchaeota archaeon]|nr:hypothetical protein [Candidatus Aenigmarchaeota archaeon]
MNRKIIIVAAALGMLVLAGIGAAIISSYGTITGAAIVKPAISWDIIETGSDVNTSATNDTYYQLETAYQGDIKWVKVKIKNNGNNTLPVNISIEGETADIELSVWDANKSMPLSNPIEVSTSDIYVWLRHEIRTNASPGSYSFTVSFLPI